MNRIIREARPTDIADIMQVMEAAKKIVSCSTTSRSTASPIVVSYFLPTAMKDLLTRSLILSLYFIRKRSKNSSETFMLDGIPHIRMTFNV